MRYPAKTDNRLGGVPSGWLSRRVLMAGVALLLALGLFTNAEAGGGWTKKKRSFYGKIGVSSFRSKNYYSLLGTLNDQGAQFQQTSVNLYAEYGLTDRLTVILNTPLFRANRFANTGTTSGFGDAIIELKYGLLTKKIPVAISIAPSFPTGKSRALVANNDVAGNVINLPIGDGEFNIWTRVYASSSLGNNTYISADAGYNFRTQGFTNQYTVGGEIGHRFGENLWINATLRQFATAGTPNPSKGSFVYGEGLQYTGYSVGAAYSVSPKISVTADYANFFGTRKNVYSGPTLGLGLSVQLN